MKKISYMAALLGVILMGSAPALKAQDCCPTWTNNDCCEWSSCDGRFNVSGEWLYWKSTQDGVQLGSIDTEVGGTALPTTLVRDVIDPSFKWDNGFRVNVGYEFPNCAWEIGANYTYMPGKGSASSLVDTTVADFVGNPNNLLDAIVPFDPTAVRSKWNMTFNQVDVDIARTVCLGESFSLRPHIGFRAIWADQNYRLAATNLVVDPGTSSFYAEHYKNKFHGYGIEGGVWANWNFGGGFSIVGHVGGSVLYTKFKVSEDFVSTISTAGLVTTLDVATASRDYWSGIPTFDYFVGLQYDSNFCDTDVYARVGWEQRILLDVNRFGLNGTDGNLSMQGLTLGLGLTF